MRVLLGQWGMLPRLRSVPDIGRRVHRVLRRVGPDRGHLCGRGRGQPYRATGSAAVRNVTLPAEYGHIALPLAAHLAANPVTRAWISAYSPRDNRAAVRPETSSTREPPARGRHLVQREEALVPGGAAARSRPAFPRRRRTLTEQSAGSTEPVPADDVALARAAPVQRRARRRTSRPAGRAPLAERIARELEARGLTGLALDRARGRYEYAGGPAEIALEILPGGPDPLGVACREIERQLNLPFPDAPRHNPFRFFAVDGRGRIPSRPRLRSFHRRRRFDRRSAQGDRGVLRRRGAGANRKRPRPTCTRGPIAVCSRASRCRSCGGSPSCPPFVARARAARSGRVTVRGRATTTRSPTSASSRRSSRRSAGPARRGASR